jgi:hypothetical protein
MKTRKFIIALFCLFVMSYSCTKNGDETLSLPMIEKVAPIDNVVPDSIQDNLIDYMPIYKGSLPPDIVGIYLASPFEVVISTSGGFDPGKIISDMTIEFYKQNSKMLAYKEKCGTSTGSSLEVEVMGTGKNFTAFFTTTGTSNNISNKCATIISGTKSADGITNLFYAFVMLEKGPDPDGKLVDVGTYRVFKDNDYLASNTSWKKSARAISNGKSMSERN